MNCGELSNVPIAYHNGQFVPLERLTIDVWDTGFVQGATVAEQLRTFRGEPFRLDEHLHRLGRGVAALGVGDRLDLPALKIAVARITAHNHRLLDPEDDLGVVVFVTPGRYGVSPDDSTSVPTVGIHSYPLPFSTWHQKYETGQPLVAVPIQQTSPRSWPLDFKCRSRMHLYLADRAARQVDPDARGLLLDARGYITETSTANILAYFPDRGLVSPRQEWILPGISLDVVRQLAVQERVPVVEADLAPEDLARAEEILLTSTPYAILPCTRFNGQPVGSGRAGRLFLALLERWNQLVGFDIAQQARRFAAREGPHPQTCL